MVCSHGKSGKIYHPAIKRLRGVIVSLAESEKAWVAFCDSDYYGLLSIMEIKCFMVEGKIKDDDCLWKKGWDKWKQPKDIPAFSYECKKSIGKGRPIPDISIPDPEKFVSVISPKVMASELSTGKNWDAKRVAIVAGSTVLAGIPGAVLSSMITKNSREKAELENSSKFINDKNK
jgi:hypothetical protein